MNGQDLEKEYKKKETNNIIRYEDLPPELERAVVLVNAAYASKETRNNWNQGDSGPQGNPLKVILAYFGVPVKFDVPAMSVRPYVNIFLIMIIVCLDISLWILHCGNVACMEYGMIPESMFRKCGITFVTHFFLHGGVLHLVGNMYFMFVFGDNVEDFLGHFKYALLLLVATIVGCASHVVFNLDSAIPCVGASGGISGILAFYAIQFPKARVGFMFFNRWSMYVDNWFKIPAWILLIIWLALQFCGLGDKSNIAYMSHIGGAGVGIIAALIIKFMPVKKNWQTASSRND